MLTLTRTEGQDIVIGDPERPIAVIRLWRVKGTRAVLGIHASKDTVIYRGEVAARLVEQRKEVPCKQS